MKLHIQINRKAQVENLDMLYSLRATLERNTPADCEKTHDENLNAVLVIAKRNLASVNVFVAKLPDGTELFFTGEALPAYVTREAALKAVGFEKAA